jgi:ABC-type antimicrobial peptide transport system permease subunit
MAYMPLEQSYSPAMTLHVRVSGQPEGLKTTIERELRSIDRDIAVNNVFTGSELLRTSLWGPRLAATLLSIFGVIALVLATVGIYGVMSYSVNQRASEIGIRIALGAERQDVLRMVLRQGMAVIVLGLLAGLAVAVGVGAVMSRLLYGVGKADLPTFGITTLVLLAVALVANYIPARRATTVDPVTVMRYE